MEAEETIVFLKYWGINPFDKVTLWSKIKFSLNAMVLTIILIQLFLEPFLNWDSVYITLGGFVEVLSSVIQMVPKVFFLMTGKQTFIKLLNEISTFWPLETLSPSLRKKIKSYRQLTKFVIRAYVLSVVMTIVSYYVRPLFFKQRTLPLHLYVYCNITNDLCYISNYVLQSVGVVTISSVFMGFDSLFIVFLVYAYCELRIIKTELINLNIREDSQEEDADVVEYLKKLIKHHDKVLKFIQEINSLYSHQLLIQCVSFIAMICFGLFLILASGFPPDFDRVIKCGSYIIVYNIQLCIYCIGGTAIIHETQSVGDAAFNSKWWIKPQRNVRVMIQMIIIRSQNLDCITFGGFGVLDLSTFTFILKTTYSFVALMQTVYGPGQD